MGRLNTLSRFLMCRSRFPLLEESDKRCRLDAAFQTMEEREPLGSE